MKKKGFTLVEVIISMVLLVMLTSLVIKVSSTINKLYAYNQKGLDTTHQLYIASTKLTRDIRKAKNSEHPTDSNYLPFFDFARPELHDVITTLDSTNDKPLINLNLLNGDTCMYVNIKGSKGYELHKLILQKTATLVYKLKATSYDISYGDYNCGFADSYDIYYYTTRPRYYTNKETEKGNVNISGLSISYASWATTITETSFNIQYLFYDIANDVYFVILYGNTYHETYRVNLDKVNGYKYEKKDDQLITSNIKGKDGVSVGIDGKDVSYSIDINNGNMERNITVNIASINYGGVNSGN